MELKTTSMYEVTTIHDRSGRRVGSYLVDKSQDSLNREQKKRRDERKDSAKDESVVFHRSAKLDVSKRDDGEISKDQALAVFNLTV